MTDIIVGQDWIEKCIAFTRKKYAKPKRLAGNWSKREIPLSQRIEMSARGSMAEVAVCMFLDVDPQESMDWKSGRPDAGYDLMLYGQKIDVKATDHPGARRLMWPVKNVAHLPSAADIFVFARVLPSKRSTAGQLVDLAGWVTRDRFIKEHTRSLGMRGIVDGTPYMNEEHLDSMDDLKQHLNNFKATNHGS